MNRRDILRGALAAFAFSTGLGRAALSPVTSAVWLRRELIESEDGWIFVTSLGNQERSDVWVLPLEDSPIKHLRVFNYCLTPDEMVRAARERAI